ncbi:MAG: hypothetical protein ABFD25_00770 [Clostridiaceae bacterium]
MKGTGDVVVRIDLTGKKFNNLLVIKLSSKTDNGGRSYWDCLCDCGRITTVEGYNLKSNSTKSCRECGTSRSALKQTTHGKTNTKLYYTWINMKTRCNNHNYEMYKNYGGKGIRVCEEWKDYLTFEKWALLNGYQDGLSIDRKDNSMDYSPENCRWATMKTQQNNRTNNRLITFRRETLTLKQWAEKLHLVYGTLQRRCHLGYPIEKVLSKTDYRRKASLQ